MVLPAIYEQGAAMQASVMVSTQLPPLHSIVWLKQGWLTNFLKGFHIFGQSTGLKWNRSLPEHWLEIISHGPILGKALQQGAQLSYVDAPLSLRRLEGSGGCERVEG